MNADTARERFQKIYARFAADAQPFDMPGCRLVRRQGRELEVIVDGIPANLAQAVARLRALSPEELNTEALSLEEIFVTTLQPEQSGPVKAVA
jgi:hypothetical protein